MLGGVREDFFFFVSSSLFRLIDTTLFNLISFSIRKSTLLVAWGWLLEGGQVFYLETPGLCTCLRYVGKQALGG